MKNTGTETAAFRKSSYSGAANSNCVEVAAALDGGVLLRDSKAPAGVVLRVPGEAARAFFDLLRNR
ncbi:DUF397 domain-containing protein [Actinomadura opuntiae]|uniref:DUF397 domain-containing protein n=1 Tax=Actinomadura sp. OS1-43 TaxID=604315 RepID=UPI00255AFD95|nr:DUF397 domain-containing protein [Actinomadura sp. OS1-43]MDL4815151.1 DUF397 domain-containing protein [Actinomadura sp. OS1-43]